VKIQEFSSLVLETIAAIELLAFYALKIHLVPIPLSQMHRVTFSRGTAKVKGLWSLFKLHGFRSCCAMFRIIRVHHCWSNLCFTSLLAHYRSLLSSHPS
jgi:hypothetical protein